jgi:hypothetical protein
MIRIMIVNKGIFKTLHPLRLNYDLGGYWNFFTTFVSFLKIK